MTDENYDDDIDPHDIRPQDDATHEEEENTTQGQTNMLETLIDHMQAYIMTCICRYLTLTTSFVDTDINDKDTGLKAKKDAITIDKSTEGDKRQEARVNR